VHVDESVLEPLRRRYGEPLLLELELELSAEERDLVVHSTRKGRHHDVTFFVFSRERLALIRKPHYLPGLWRPPGGGLKPGERFEDGTRREALEELGVEIELRRYLVRTSAVFTHGDLAIPWQTHVFEAVTHGEHLAPVDTREISAARWGTLAELAGPIRKRLLETGSALWRYRVALHDAAAEALRAPTERPPA
jgi:ADP-ribose pyrophosphatase YjhB (NUDIX family)